MVDNWYPASPAFISLSGNLVLYDFFRFHSRIHFFAKPHSSVATATDVEGMSGNMRNITLLNKSSTQAVYFRKWKCFMDVKYHKDLKTRSIIHFFPINYSKNSIAIYYSSTLMSLKWSLALYYKRQMLREFVKIILWACNKPSNKHSTCPGGTHKLQVQINTHIRQINSKPCAYMAGSLKIWCVVLSDLCQGHYVQTLRIVQCSVLK